MAEARREEWLRRLRGGERVRLYGGYRTRRSAALALAIALAFAIAETILAAQYAGLIQFLLLPVVAALLTLSAFYEWGRVAYSAIQLLDEYLLLWDWRNHPRRFEYADLEAVACVKRFPRNATVGIWKRTEGSSGPLDWTAVLTWPWRKEATAVADEIARRARLGLRVEGLWTRPYAEELPPVLFWE